MKFLLTCVALAGIAAGQTPQCDFNQHPTQHVSIGIDAGGSLIIINCPRPHLADLLPLPEPLPPPSATVRVLTTMPPTKDCYISRPVEYGVTASYDGTEHVLIRCNDPLAESQDVPAIQVKDGNSFVGTCGRDQKEDYPNWHLCIIPRWTCKDTSRILLTAEDGTRHCVKF